MEIPDQVFVNINHTRQVKGLNDAQKKKLKQDDYKPQYMDFRNPFLLHLFSKLIDKAPQQVKIEEMLPAPDQLLEVEGKRYVTEYVVQWIS